MALDDSALSELLAAFRAGEGVDLIRDAVRLVMQELIEVEATEVIGAKPYERTDDPGERTERAPAADVGDPGRRYRVEDPEALARESSSRRCSSPAAASIRPCTRW